MTNEDFQKTILHKLDIIENRQQELHNGIDVLNKNQDQLQKNQEILENQQSINEILGEHDIAIRTLKRKIG